MSIDFTEFSNNTKLAIRKATPSYKQRVTGSNPVVPTNKDKPFRKLKGFSVLAGLNMV